MKFIYFAVLFLHFLFCSITYRHDVPIEKYLKKALEEPFENTIRIFEGQNLHCSGVLINNQYVLSAAHCFVIYDKKDTIIEINDKKIYTYVPLDYHLKKSDSIYIMYKNQLLSIDTIYFHPDYHPMNNEGKIMDVALLKLSSPINELSTLSLNAKLNNFTGIAWMAGYGSSCPADKAWLCRQYDLKMAAQTYIDSTGMYRMYSEFVAPDSQDCQTYTKRQALELEGITLGGDSGSGLFREVNGNWELIGISPGGGLTLNQIAKIHDCGYYGKVNYWLKISVIHEWIMNNISQNQ